ncbi:Sorting nexin-30 [Sparganum proliferum]
MKPQPQDAAIINVEAMGKSSGPASDTTTDAERHVDSGPELSAHIVDVIKNVSSYEVFISYEIECIASRPDYPVGKFNVSRRYREFDWLHRRLQQACPFLFVPPLPGKKVMTQFDRCSTVFVDRRSSGLQTFLNKCILHPILSSNPNLIAFLTYSTPRFQDFMQDHPAQNALLSLISPSSSVAATTTDRRASGNASPVVSGDAARQSRSLSTTEALIHHSSLPTLAILRQSDDFLNFHHEVSEYATLCQRLSSVTDNIVNQLTVLAFDYAELAKTLADWPPDMLQTPGSNNHQPFSTTQDADEAQGDTAKRTPGPSVVADAVRKTASATHFLATRLSAGPQQMWQGASAFSESIKDVLKHRSSIQAAYMDTANELQTRLESESPLSSATPTTLPQSSGSSSLLSMRRLSLLWKKKPLETLLSKSNSLQDELAFCNSQVRAEFDRWQTDRRAETIATLTALTSAYVEYWSLIADAWRDSIRTLDGSVATKTAASAAADPTITIEPDSKPCDGLEASRAHPYL